MRYPFKFLDSYNQDDQDIFFGRDDEIEELYKMVFQTSVIVVYGASGTGKTSLINCGLAGKFQPHDWFPVMVRRGADLNKSLDTELAKFKGKPVVANAYAGWIDDGDDVEEEVSQIENINGAIQNTKQIQLNPVCTSIRELYQKYYKPIYLIFDQFEELFILGSPNEERTFINNIKEILQSGLPVKIIFSIREEYLGYLYEFERLVPQLMRRTVRIEPMNFEKVNQVILGVANYEDSIVKVKAGEVENIAQGVFDKIKGRGKTLTIQLPFLQVFLHKFYMKITGDENHKTPAEFSVTALNTMEEIDDVMIDFLAEQVQRISEKLQDKYRTLTPELTWKILSPFSTIEGTKDPISRQELYDRLAGMDRVMVDEVLGEFNNCQILRRDPNSQLIELSHDSLAKPIADKRSVDEKTLLQVKRLISHQVSVNEQARSHFDERQLIYIEPYLEKIRLSAAEEQWIDASRDRIADEKLAERKQHEYELVKATRRNRILRSLLALAVIAGCIAVFYMVKANKQQLLAIEETKKVETEKKNAETEKRNAERNAVEALKQQAIAESARQAAELSRRIADTARKHADFSRAEALKFAARAERNEKDARISKELAGIKQKLAEKAAGQAQRAELAAVASQEEAIEAERLADSLQDVATAERDAALKSINELERVRATSIGSYYEGGMIVSWSDAKGSNGVIASNR